MNRGTWLLAAVALLLALARGGAGRGAAGEGEGNREHRDPSSPARRGESTAPLHLGQRLIREYLAGERSVLPRRAAPIELSILIATLPDPNASHLDWAFDSGLDSLRRAFESGSWVLDRYEVPLGEESDSLTGLSGRPGGLLFRQVGTDAERLALLYVVGEISTSGIDRDALALALHERRELLGPEGADLGLVPSQRTREVVRIVGPFFSGSARSLRAALDSDPSILSSESVEVVSGAATSEGNRAALERAETDRENGGRAISFRTTLHTDDTLQRVLAERVLPWLGLEAREIAVLQEQTTEYGSQSGGATRGMLVVPFPMSISTLRQAYERNGEAVPSEIPVPGRSASTSIPLDLQDQVGTREAPSSSSALTPPSIDLLLEEMTRMLAQYGIRGVLLFATDVRDKLFLGTELKRRLPDLQLFTTEGNVLYLWPSLNRWLRGMIVLSTYPMLLRDPSWSAPGGGRRQLIFASEGAEGIFNATLVQLGLPEAMADYTGLASGSSGTQEAQALQGPPVWVTAVGAGTMLPLLTVDPAKLSKAAPAWAPLVPSPQGSTVPGRPGRGERSTRGFLGVSAILAFASWLIVVFARAGLEAARSKSFSRRLQARIPDGMPVPFGSPTAGRIHLASLCFQHELYTLCHLAALWSVLLPNGCLLAFIALQGGAMPILAALVAALASLGGMAVLVWRAVLLYRARLHRALGAIDFGATEERPTRAQRWMWHAEKGFRFLIFVFGVAYFVATFCLSCRIVCLALGGEERSSFQLFLHRAIEVDQGLSALVPTSLIGVLLALWCTWHLRRLCALARGEPAENAIDSVLAGTLETCPAARVRRRLFRAIPDSAAIFAFLPLLGALAFLAARIQRPIDDLALGWRDWPSFFALLTRFGLAAAIGSAVWVVLRLRALWKALADLLTAVDEALSDLPFKELKEELGSTVSLSLVSTNRLPELEHTARESWKALQSHAGLPEELGAALERAERSLALRKRRDADDLLRPDLVAALQAVMRVRREARGLDAVARGLTGRVVATELLLYLEWVLQYIRWLALFLVGAILLTTALVWSYPLQPQGTVQSLTLAVFAGTLVALLWLLASMNRNPALSRIARTDPGRLTWDRSLFVNLGLFVLAPLITVLTAQAPALRQVFEESIKPILTALSVG